MRALLRERPGIAHHQLKLRLAWLPSELRADLLAGRDEPGRIPRPPIGLDNLHGLSGDPLHRLDHLSNREPVARTEVEDPVLAGAYPVQRQQMRRGQVLDVDVVTDRGAI